MPRTMLPKIHLLSTLAAAALFTGCTHYATVTERPAPALICKEPRLLAGLQLRQREPQAALGNLLAGLEATTHELERNPTNPATRQQYNYALARVFEVIRSAKLDPWSRPLEVPTPGTSGFLLMHQPDSRPEWNPIKYDFTPADQFDVGGSYVREMVRKEGLGAPLVAVSRKERQDAATDFVLPRVYYGVTAVIRFSGRRAVIAFEDPLAVEQVSVAGRSFPLAADFTVPLAVMLASAQPEKFELARLLNPEKFADTARIARLQPYDPQKTVVLVIHGLKDSPATWTPMLNALRGDEEIRRNYQFWFYSYPSGYPYPYSAAILRKELDAVEKRYPLRKPMVLVGHSMGGCISRLLITDTSDQKLWLALMGKPPAEARLSAETRRLMTDSLIFRARPEVGRVIFIAAPLRGADMAAGWAGRIGSMLVRSPKTLLRVGQDALKLATFQPDDLRLSRLPNSVDTLAPNNRFVRAIQTMPIKPGVPYHVISGDRGQGGNKDHTAPVMSDGLVPYWSSHLAGAESELVVASNHTAHQNAQTITEVKRILKHQAVRPRGMKPPAHTL